VDLAMQGVNAGYVAELYERFLADPSSVDPSWREQFTREPPAFPPRVALAPSVAPAAVSGTPWAAAGAAELAQAIRTYGHLAAQLDPLGSAPPGDPQLDPRAHDLEPGEMERLPASVVGGPIGLRTRNAAEAIDQLRAVYCGTTGYEFGHLQAPTERDWLFEAVEAGRYRPPADPVDERRLLHRLTELSAFERFLHRAYPGQTRFSIEGLGMMIPMLDELIARAGEDGTRTILLGMAHRGRLNVLSHVMGKPYRRILAEFEGRVAARRAAPSDHDDAGWSGDVKYHAGGERAVAAEVGERAVRVVMAPNPSHLEFVNPVVEGMARAADEDRRRAGEPRQDEVASLAVLIHGDAAFPGQGIVAETLNLSRLPGFRTGGTLHLIANNQLGFTTAPVDARSTLYASDLAKGFEIPVVHVNADDPIACLAAVRLAVAYRTAFRKDFLIDLIGYRRWGHNEGDEPAFTQPRMYRAIAAHPTVRERFAAGLVERGVAAPDEPAKLLQAGLDEFQRIREEVLAEAKAAGTTEVAQPPTPDGVARAAPRPTPVSLEELRALNEALLRFPAGFKVSPKLERPLGRRRAALDSPDGTLDWGHAETLAFATILREGTPIRLTGQDVVRGTFSQRHLTFFDAETGAPFTPLASLPGVSASFDVRNSPLSENAVLGFEYGYTLQAPDALVLWEAQYGDFVNGAQVIVDEFVVSGEAKWGLTSGLVMLLPHAWEGQGPDHSSGRLERFLEMAAEDNLWIVYPTTAAQYFHLLRAQAASLRSHPRPLVVMSPKSLLRRPQSEARAAELAASAFRPVLDDARTAARPADVRRLVLCSGKVWVDVESDARRAEDTSTAVVRLEQLYPFPTEELGAAVARYKGAREVVWLQEEPRNMGAWTYVAPRLRALLGPRRRVTYVGRPDRASPAEGWAEVHAAEQRRILDELFAREAIHAH
jgi:2-oxoglutarate dehydrogenase E1 component